MKVLLLRFSYLLITRVMSLGEQSLASPRPFDLSHFSPDVHIDS